MNRISRLTAAAAMAVLTVTAPAPAQQAQETVKDTFGDWAIRCVDANKTCVMQQTGKGARGNDVVEIRIRKLEGVTAQDGSNVPAAIQVLAPLGVLLGAGVRIQVDDKPVRAAPFELCGPAGCVVRQPMSEDFLDEMRGGSKASVTIVAVPQNEVSADISLSGFTKAFRNLEP